MECIGNMKECSTIEADVDKCRLHTGENPYNLAEVDITGYGFFNCSFDVEIHQVVIFQNRNSYFMFRTVKNHFFSHDDSSRLIIWVLF